jgi:histidinol-phosphate aminotransferase
VPDLSRRTFAHLVGAAAAAAAFPLSIKAAPPANVRISSNENPYGPSPAALQAIRDALPLSNRYTFDAESKLIADIAKFHGVAADQIVLGAGSSEILRIAAEAFLSDKRPLVQADTTFEAISNHARAAGAPVRQVPLNGRFEHDLPRMLEAARGAGLIYICNPNNPTATITPVKALREFIAAVPSDTYILIDEAYHHYASSPDYATLIDHVPRHPNLIVMRTFSKVYGMAGLRCGYSVAQEATTRRMREFETPINVSVLTIAAARASLADARYAAEQSALNAQTRSWLRNELRNKRFLPSETNFVMIDTGREVAPLIRSLRERGVFVGRVFPTLPHHLRVTIGKPEEMQRFVEAFAATSS